jgi:hypothetical protein
MIRINLGSFKLSAKDLRPTIRFWGETDLINLFDFVSYQLYLYTCIDELISSEYLSLFSFKLKVKFRRH